MQESNKRIAKNTLVLYVRTFITMIIGLYTSRLMLESLGVVNYGVNAVVGGIVGMSSLVTVSMSVAISRYLSFTIGEKDDEKLRLMFSTAVNVQIIMSVIAVVVIEIGGLWFLNTTANIPPDKMYAAHWVFQTSVVGLVLSLTNSPYNSLIVSYERMSIYAYTSVVDSLMRLLICFILLRYSGERLILLANLQLSIGVFFRIFYVWYCNKNFKAARYSYRLFDKGLIKEITIFSGWNLLNNSTWIFSTQGVNLLVNVFFGVIFNASRAIATTVNTIVQNFVRNFTVSFTPQITKKYAAGDVEGAVLLTTRGAKFTWLMTFVFIVPICMEADTLLFLWLGTVPPDSALFLRFTLIESLAAISSNQLFQLILADGRLKRVNVQNALVTGMIFPVIWLAFKMGAPVWVSYVVCIIFFLMLNMVFLINLKRLLNLNVRDYYNRCLKPCLLVSITSFIIPTMVVLMFEQSLMRFCVVCILSFVWTLFCSYWLGLSAGERAFVKDKATMSYNQKVKIVFSRAIS